MMMNIRQYIHIIRQGVLLLCLALCFPLHSCDKDSDDAPFIADNTIGFNAGMESTRAGLTDLQTNGFSVWGGFLQAGGTINQVFDGTAVSYNDIDGWGYSPAKYWNSGKSYNFFGVYPLQSANALSSFADSDNVYYKLKFDIPANAGTDLLVATPAPVVATKPYPTVNMTFTHALSKINVNVQKNGANDEDEVIVHSVSFNNIKRTGIFNSQTKLWGETTSGSLTFLNLNVELSHTEQTQVVGGKLLMPQVIAANSIQLSIYYSIRAGDSFDYYTASADLPVSTITQWEQQKEYTYNVTLGAAKNDILFGIPDVKDWKQERPVGGSIMIQ